ncbi:hypothetical protein KAW65_03720 [candidate division WOR-3 bacterium]|nr:hypothetical protein [candidate division WOR-3 bacterium]
MKSKTKKGGYSHYHSDEEIRKYMDWPAKTKLDWLEEINEFLYKAMPPENRKIMEKFRKGEI